jgi:GDPmannose 4,6-dehydratase
MKRALICGISGQDGSLLARLLLKKGYEVFGTSRDAEVTRFENLVYLGIRDKVIVLSMALNDFRSVLQVLKEVQPTEIYNLAGQTSVALSFQQPVETLESIASGTLNLLEAIRFEARQVHLYNAASGECFGDTEERNPATEASPFRPRSPYAVAKAAAFWEVANYREAYGLFACSGLLFNHESELRPMRFVTKKVVKAACRIASGSSEKLFIGDVKVMRDWGYAPEYVEAMWMMLQRPKPEDFVIATGETRSLAEFIEAVFEELDLDWRRYTECRPSLIRASEISRGFADPSRAATSLGWRAETKMRQLARILVLKERDRGQHKLPGNSQ